MVQTRAVLDKRQVVVDSSHHPLAMELSLQLPSVTNYATSTIEPRFQRTHRRQSRNRQQTAAFTVLAGCQ